MLVLIKQEKLIGYKSSRAVRKYTIKLLKHLLECCHNSEQMKVCLAFFYEDFKNEIEAKLNKLDCTFLIVTIF